MKIRVFCILSLTDYEDEDVAAFVKFLNATKEMFESDWPKGDVYDISEDVTAALVALARIQIASGASAASIALGRPSAPLNLEKRALPYLCKALKKDFFVLFHFKKRTFNPYIWINRIGLCPYYNMIVYFPFYQTLREEGRIFIT